MKGKLDLEIEPDDVSYHLKELVREVAYTEVSKMIKEQAAALVKAEIDKILQPLVLKVLTEEKLDFSGSYYSYSHKASLDDKIKSLTAAYLNTPCYLYSRTERAPSKRYRTTTNDIPLINRLVSDEIAFYVDTEFTPKLREMITAIVTDKTKLEAALKEQLKSLVAEKIK